MRFRCCPSSLYTFPFVAEVLLRVEGAWLGITSEGFPEFGQFYFSGFPVSTQVVALSPLRLPISPRPRDSFSYRRQREPGQRGF